MPETLFEIGIIFALILLNGLFAMSEIAVVSARTIRLQQMAGQGNRGAAAALELAESPNRFLSTVQVGITLVGIFAGAFGGANIAGELALVLDDLPYVGPYAMAVSLALVVGVITFLSVVVGELVPKRIALQNTERIASLIARPMAALAVAATPIVRLLSVSTDAVLALVGLQGTPDVEVSEEEIRVMVQQGAQAGIIEEAERDMVESVFRLGDRRLEGMMTPRPEIVWLDVNEPEQQLRDVIHDSPHSRFPVCDGDLDHVIGIVRARDLLFNCLEGRPLDVQSVMQEPVFAPEGMPALNALERFKESGQAMVMLIDEYGGVEGLVTLIDILEQIVGDIPTQEELIQPPIVQRDEHSWLVDGLLSVDEFKTAFAIRTLPGEGSYQTLGGFVVFMLGRIPTAGAHFGWGGYRFEVADMDGRRVDKILLETAPEEDEENGAEPPELVPPVGG
ncbi:MAG: hemolysin family protein [Candidatus Promineifilaceae bacterium]|nr:hemolysin family protein [Candidatus Promineifilaceae bacterium]